MIKANIYDKKLVVENFAVSDGVMFDTVKFTFPDNWNGYKKTAVFKTEDGETFNVVLDRFNPLCVNENECYIPYEVIKSPYFYLSIFGVLDDSIATTTSVKVKVLQSGYAEGAEPSEPTPTEYQQLINLTQETKEIAQSVRTDADNGVFNGKQGIQGEKGEKGEKGDKGDKGDTGEVTFEYANNTFAPAIKNTVSGEVVMVNDVSSIGHNLKIQLKNSDEKENLITYPYNNLPTEKNGITVTDNGDGSITLSGAATEDSSIYLPSGELAEGKYIVSILENSVSGLFWRFSFDNYQSDNPFAGYYEIKNNFILSIPSGYEYAPVRYSGYIVIEKGTVLENVTVYPRIVSEIVDFSGVSVSRYGKNLFAPDSVISGYVSSNGVWVESAQGEKSVIIKCIPNTYYTISFQNITKTMRVSTFAKYPINNEQGRLLINSGNKTNYTFNTGNSNYAAIWFYNNYGESNTFEEIISGLQIEKGQILTEYEPFIEQTATANSDGTVECITSVTPDMTLLTDTDGIVMDIEYIADTKKYIDNKFAELSAAILNN